MKTSLQNWNGLLRGMIAAVTFGAILAIRINGIGTHFRMLGDQIRDWSIALGPFSELPLIGPPTHVGGYTIGPAFNWILWAIRVSVGPWFQNLPHAGGIGQATLQSGADTLLLLAIWRYTGSRCIALATIVLIAPAAYDLCLSALVWNPTTGATLAKAARMLTRGRSASIRRAVVAAASLAMVAPTACKTALLDRLLSTTDNRTATARAIVDLFPPNNLIYQSG